LALSRPVRRMVRLPPVRPLALSRPVRRMVRLPPALPPRRPTGRLCPRVASLQLTPAPMVVSR
ncbi:hypothetical protein, partial [Mycobacterium marinum]|uniref:hypothetical protein n=1 Tax=Mycobacterium marinum TaxID=1781 RepID=UPI0035624350